MILVHLSCLLRKHFRLKSSFSPAGVTVLRIKPFMSPSGSGFSRLFSLTVEYCCFMLSGKNKEQEV